MSNTECPNCGAPGRYCICVLMERVRLAERTRHEAIMQAARYRDLWHAAAACLTYNRAKLAKPRGKDEARLLGFAATDLHGHFWSGKTDGWLPDPPAEKPAVEPQTDLLDGAA